MEALADHQLTIHNLQFEKRQLVKERDELERLLSDSEAKNFEAEKLKSDLRGLLRQSYRSVQDLKFLICSLLDGDP